MKYWRGYLVAAIFVAISKGLAEFAQSHWELVDMVYPYVSRLIQNYLADWSGGISFCLWQVLLLAGGVLVLASIVMMVVWKWNPFQWFGWILAAASVVFFLNTAIYGLNDFAGPIDQDIRLEIADYTLSELEEASAFYQAEANKLAQEVSRNPDGTLKYPTFAELAAQAGEGFENQTYEHYRSVFAGSNVPVKELSWPGLFSSRGITGVTCGLTGESAVNSETPTVALPFAISREMAKRRCISNDQDATFAAFLACDANSAPEFRYAAYFMAYEICCEAISVMNTTSTQFAVIKLREGENSLLKQDMDNYLDSFAAVPMNSVVEEGEGGPDRSQAVDLLVSWHIQEYILPTLQEEVVIFDPQDESQVDLSGLPNVAG